MSDRREHERLRFWLPVEMSGAERCHAISHDASDGGLLVVCDRALGVGEIVEVTFRLPPTSGSTLEVPATIIRSGRNDEDPDGLWPFKLALRFEDPVPALHAYLETLEPPGS